MSQSSDKDVGEECHTVRNAQASSDDDDVEVTIVARRPRAIVVLLGWVGADRDHLNEYARLYHKLECCTVVVPMHVNQNIPFATTACREVARLVRMSEMSEMGYGSVPLLFHVFGNGGTMLLQHIDQLIKDWVSQKDLEDLQHQTRVSSCPVPLRSLKPMGSLKSLPSLTSTVDDSDGEDAVDDSPIAKDPLWTPSKRSRSLMRVSPKRLPFDQCRIDQQQGSATDVFLQTKVKRIDVERPAAVSSIAQTPKYNMEPRAIRTDFSLVASRLFMGGIIFDVAPPYPTWSTDLAPTTYVSNPMRRIFAKGAQVGRVLGRILFSNQERRNADEGYGRVDQRWKNMHDICISRRHVFVSNGVAFSVKDQVQELISSQRERGVLVNEVIVKETDRVARVVAYSNMIEEVFERHVKKVPKDDDDDEDDWSSDDGSCTNEGEEWHDAMEEDESHMLYDYLPVRAQ